jgi:pyrimidine-nucleoside phosphorylase
VNLLTLIEAKRDGQALTAAELGEIVSGVVSGQLPDYQIAAFLMAVYFRGLNSDETTALTLAMRDSGDGLKFPKDKRPLVDKHSTGGVGDKVSLPLAPLLACLGFRVPMISGRGLGITGGTLDKLDSIPGFQTLLPPKRIIEIVQEVGCVICGQTDRMVPADKKLYALRDVTGTVPSIPLITASILSKKLAENLDALILDVKFGTAAFMSTRPQARKLAQAMVALGTQCGVNMRAVLTDMNTPLGRAAGNWLEVKESVACLAGQGPKDLQQLVITFAAHQGTNLVAFNRKLSRDHTAPFVMALRADRSGFVTRCDARLLGEVIRDLGGGRLTKATVINPDVGLDQIAKPGEAVKSEGVLLRIHVTTRSQANAARSRLEGAFEIAAHPPRLASLVSAVSAPRPIFMPAPSQ